MKKYGLTEAELQKIVSVLSVNTRIESAILFGSRALGNFKEASDIDIAIKSKNADMLLTGKIKSTLEEDTNIPYFFDIIDYATITNHELKKHIDEKGVVIYSKK